MSNNYFNENDPTIPVHPPGSSQGNQPQEKMVLGGFQDGGQQGAPRLQRRPYQYQPNQQGQQPPQQANSAQRPAGGQYYQQQPPAAYPQQPQHYPQGQPVGSQLPPLPARNVPPPIANVPDAPHKQSGQFSGTPGNPQRPVAPKRPKRRVGCLVTSLIVLLIVLIVGGFAISISQRVLAFGSAISTQKSPLSTQTNYMGTSDRVNVLVMGFGGGNHDGAYLTDSLLILSIIPSTHHTTLVSVPRDLWVQVPEGSGNYGKINSVYEYAAGTTNKNPAAGGNAAVRKISLVTGLDVKYWMTIDFTGFRELINSIGGVDVYVPNSFNACYPKNDNANIDPSWIKIQFNKGNQHMDGETAMRYARAREPLEVCSNQKSENYAELTDFGRSARQQIIIKAVLAKVKQTSTWTHLYGAMDALQKTLYTNLSFADLAELALKMDLNDPRTQRVGLSNQNVLADSQSNDGQYILLPQNNNWQAVKDYVKQHLYA